MLGDEFRGALNLLHTLPTICFLALTLKHTSRQVVRFGHLEAASLTTTLDTSPLLGESGARGILRLC